MTDAQLARADVSICEQCGRIIGPVLARLCDACVHENDAEYRQWVEHEERLWLERHAREAAARRRA